MTSFEPIPNRHATQATVSQRRLPSGSTARTKLYSIKIHQRLTMLSVRWITQITDSVCSGCTVHSSATLKAIGRDCARRRSGEDGSVSVRRTSPYNARAPNT